MTPESIAAAFLVGLLGGVHCIGMCGGIVGALSAGLPAGVRSSRVRFLAVQLAYNGGRISSYVAAGVLIGFFGQKLGGTGLLQGIPVGRAVAAVIMILLGVYLAGWWHALLFLERAGSHLWKVLEPLGRRFIPVRSIRHAYLLGLVWGWLPCGMVYSVLALALVSGSAVDGGAIMLAFGLGTLPTLVAMGLTYKTLSEQLQKPWVRVIAGILVIAMGVALLVANPSAHGHHAHPH